MDNGALEDRGRGLTSLLSLLFSGSEAPRRPEGQQAHQPELASLARVAVLFEMLDARIGNVCFRRADEVVEAAARHDASQVFAGVRGMCRSLGSLPKGPDGRHGPALRDCLEH